MRAGNIDDDTFKIQYVQVRKTHTYADLKKRLADVATVYCKVAGDPLAVNQIRLWHCSGKKNLLDSFQKVSRSTRSSAEPTSDLEENSGVEFPGKSYEPLVGSTMNFEDRIWNNEVVVVEIGVPHFEYKYEKQERVFVGTCEWCSQKN